MSRVSVIVPVYNTERYLARCVDSILAQSFADFELVLVDDGCLHGGGALCDGYAARDPRVKALHQKNGGLSAARNAGIDWTLANSDCEYITFVDSDDWVSPNYLAALLSACESSGCKTAAVGLRQVSAGSPAPECGDPAVPVRLGVEDYWRSGELFFSISCAKLFHKTLFADVRFPPGRFHEDEFTTHRLVFQDAFVSVVRSEEYFYYRREGSISKSQWSLRRLDAVEGMDAQIGFFKERGLDRLVSSTRCRLVGTLADLLSAARAGEAPRAVRRDLSACLKREFAAMKKQLDQNVLRRAADALRTGLGWAMRRPLTVLRWLSRYGAAEAARLIASRGAGRPHGISALAMFKFGVGSVGSRLCPLTKKSFKVASLVRSARSVDVVLTMLWGGGAAMYLQTRLAAASEGTLVFVVKPIIEESGRLQVEAWLGGEIVERFWIRSLDAFHALVGKDVRIVVNELVQWWLYERDPVAGAASLSGLVDSICSLKAKLGARLLYLVHDYYCICPRFMLLAPDCRYCGSEVSGERCALCLQSRETAPCAIAAGTSIAAWRDAFGRLLRACDDVRTFSEDSRWRVESCYPGLALSCSPHEVLQEFHPATIAPQGELVIGVFGNLYLAKGSREVLALARHLEAEGIGNARLVVAGQLETDGERLPGNVKVLGAYRREDMPAIVEREKMAVAFFPSVCPETFSFVVHELIALDLPLVCYNLGAQKDAVAAYRRGSVVDGFSPESTWAAIRAAVPDLWYNIQRT